MNIGYISSDAYSQYLGISMLSLFENNINTKEINVYIYDDGIQQENKNKILKIAKEYKRNIFFCKSEKLSQVAAKMGFPSFRNSFTTYAKIFPTLSFPIKDRILIIDCDTIINQSLQEVYDTDMKDALVMATPELSAYFMSSEDKEVIYREKFYYNTGFLLWNVRGVIESDFIERARKVFNSYGKKLRLADQSLFNLTVNEGDVIPLHYKYNYNINLHVYPDLRKNVQKMYAEFGLGYKNINPDKKISGKQIAVIHYLGDKRPWILGKFAPLSTYYNKYWEMSPWKDIKRESYFNYIIIDKIKRNPNSIFANCYLGKIYAFIRAICERYNLLK